MDIDLMGMIFNAILLDIGVAADYLWANPATLWMVVGLIAFGALVKMVPSRRRRRRPRY
jgi:hypothetical protein